MDSKDDSAVTGLHLEEFAIKFTLIVDLYRVMLIGKNQHVDLRLQFLKYGKEITEYVLKYVASQDSVTGAFKESLGRPDL